MQRRDESLKLFHQVLDLDPSNRSALTSIGFLSRENDDPKIAEEYFLRLAKLYPNDYVPYLALGDLYTSQNQFPHADANYQNAYRLEPKRPLVVARGANAALEGHNLELAKSWLGRSDAEMDRDAPDAERERYLTHGTLSRIRGLGTQGAGELPKDPEAPV
jgi:tetratricopeptide (TPR) repeat protein